MHKHWCALEHTSRGSRAGSAGEPVHTCMACCSAVLTERCWRQGHGLPAGVKYEEELGGQLELGQQSWRQVVVEAAAASAPDATTEQLHAVQHILPLDVGLHALASHGITDRDHLVLADCARAEDAATGSLPTLQLLPSDAYEQQTTELQSSADGEPLAAQVLPYSTLQPCCVSAVEAMLALRHLNS